MGPSARDFEHTFQKYRVSHVCEDMEAQRVPDSPLEAAVGPNESTS